MREMEMGELSGTRLAQRDIKHEQVAVKSGEMAAERKTSNIISVDILSGNQEKKGRRISKERRQISLIENEVPKKYEQANKNYQNIKNKAVHRTPATGGRSKEADEAQQSRQAEEI